MEDKTFADLGLSPERLAAVEALGWTKPTPIQAKAIPPGLEGRDVVGIAQTGTGKTAAFMIPGLERVSAGDGLQILVLCPTRELAQQVSDDTAGFSKGTNIRTEVIHGGVGYGPQITALEQGFEVTGVDPNRPPEASYPVEALDIAREAELTKLLEANDAVVVCLPYHLSLPVARLAHASGTHYLDLTEDVATTKAIQKMGETSEKAMIPQCGLAPGFIGIVGASLVERFDTVRSLRLRVGALPQHPTGLLGYAFNWSPEGVVNEYLEPCEVLKDGVPQAVPPMGQLETIFVGGKRLEAFTTSGGLGTMCETYAGKIDELNYKTMRYPGHCELMQFFFHELGMDNSRADAGKILVNAKPPVNDDVVYVHASAEGVRGGQLLREEFVRAYYPMRFGDRVWRAISWTTAGSVVSVVEMLAEGHLPQKGFVQQEAIELERFLGTKFGQHYAGGRICPGASEVE